MKLNLVELEKEIPNWIKTFSQKQILLFKGDLGAGKTQTVKMIVSAIGGGCVSSPTYSLINEYKTPKGLVIHVDLYRLENEWDLESTGFWDLFTLDEALICIEWPQKLGAQELPRAWSQKTMEISIVNDSEREFLWS